ncbi:MAG TPA: hypothetical protein VM553_02640 [Dongiaceae bacterium]|nr:hypothetical protein [Dongiaceae bacterium]
MTFVPITLQERQGIPRVAEPLRVGVPLAEGVVADISRLQLQDENGAPLPADIQATAHWADGSVRWCLLDFSASIPALGVKTLHLVVVGSVAAPVSPLVQVQEENGALIVNTGASRFRLVTNRLGLGVLTSGSAGIDLQPPQLITSNGETCQMQVEKTEFSSRQAQARLTVSQNGFFKTATDELFCRFESRFQFFANSTRVHWQFKLHNPRAAQHPGGLWDLGDPGSVFFRQLSACLQLPSDNPVQFQLEPGQDWISAESGAQLFQASSGGEHWNSRNHVNQQGHVTLPFRGYQFKNGSQEVAGERASPLLFSAAGCSIYTEHFWQNFPKAIVANTDSIDLQLFPQQANDAFELQGGEQKTHQIQFDFSTHRDALSGAHAPLTPTLTPDYVASTGCIQHFSAQREPLDEFIATGLDAQRGFLAKREIIDEYGWRHFGDIFADHESLYLKNGELFISHYNNQYDPLYGFIRQFLHTGNSVWMEMANDLAQHVTDIDIYHTKEDRAEYNGGLFWHTDHYVDAFTASHRTYSRQQKPNGVDVTGGGGPGGQHCYSHGLLLHYFLTGAESSRKAVLELAHWIGHIYDGTGTLVEQLLRVKSQALPRIKAAGGGDVLNHRYPLDRGVGNYINAVLDSFAITADPAWLQQAERIIRGTVHPQDRIADREFNDIERTWFHTVFFQAVIRFLTVKQQQNQTDDAGYRYALDTVLHYAQWIADNDTPYLQHADKLDYPNDTWTAQDIRKANILYFASAHAPQQIRRQQLRARADYFYQYVCQQLFTSDTRHFSRILAILMQNHGPHAYDYSPLVQPNTVTKAVAQNDSPYVSRGILARQAIVETLQALARLSLKKELNWLRFRNGLFQKIYTRLYGHH